MNHQLGYRITTSLVVRTRIAIQHLVPFVVTIGKINTDTLGDRVTGRRGSIETIGRSALSRGRIVVMLHGLCHGSSHTPRHEMVFLTLLRIGRSLPVIGFLLIPLGTDKTLYRCLVVGVDRHLVGACTMSRMILQGLVHSL